MRSMDQQERERNLRAIDASVDRDVDNFLARHDYDQDPGFSEEDLADAVEYERFDKHAALQRIRALQGQGRVYREGGKWHVGSPTQDTGVDQI
jgi:hypothetical protein